MNKLSIIIPAYNEEDRIIYTLEKSLAYLNTREYNSEILVVSDGSTDNTASVVKGFDPGQKVRLEFLEYHPNKGKGYAVRYGMLRGTYDFIMFMDADYSVEMSEVEKGINLIEGGADIAIASRTIAGSIVSQHQNFFRELSAKLYTFTQSLFLGIDYKDTQCGFKLFRKETAKNLFSKQLLDSVIFDPEILWLAKNEGNRVKEFPVTWTHMEDSRIQYDSLRKSLFVFEELFRIKKLHKLRR
ncbi:MAG: glycosyltransferase family 2 protein [Deltaproteobacteria bacterium]|nr:glycosyltransferase family 2 protein [Deltaproteobacteria bacterium]